MTVIFFKNHLPNVIVKKISLKVVTNIQTSNLLTLTLNLHLYRRFRIYFIGEDNMVTEFGIDEHEVSAIRGIPAIFPGVIKNEL